MTEDFFMRLCDVYGFAPSRALRELVDAAIGQAVVAERYKAARLAEPVQEPVAMPPSPPVSQWKRGCAVCGIGSDGKAYGYVCPRSDCPTKVTCGGAV